MQNLLIFLSFILYIKISYFHAFKLVGYTVLRNTSRTQNLFKRKKENLLWWKGKDKNMKKLYSILKEKKSKRQVCLCVFTSMYLLHSSAIQYPASIKGVIQEQCNTTGHATKNGPNHLQPDSVPAGVTGNLGDRNDQQTARAVIRKM